MTRPSWLDQPHHLAHILTRPGCPLCEKHVTTQEQT